jgi:Family of unknown function (DUF5995)
MESIETSLGDADGLKWFNWLYLDVTRTILAQAPAMGWNRPQWIVRLDVVFANLYFDAIQSVLTGGKPPKSWQVLFDARFIGGIDRIQYALAGMNAHINHDLALALLQTDKEFNVIPTHGSPEHADFELVNVILECILPQVLHTLAQGPFSQVLQDTGKIGRLLAMWNVRAARDLAWDFADHLGNLPGFAQAFARATQDQLTGAIGRGILALK